MIIRKAKIHDISSISKIYDEICDAQDISPKVGRQRYGSLFVKFYEEYAREKACFYLRMDTNAINQTARALYKKLGYEEIGIVPCDFNGIPGFQMVLLEKYIA